MTPLESPSASHSHLCVSWRCCAGQLHHAGSNWLGRVSSVRLPFAVEEAAANSHFFCLALYSLPRGLQHHVIRLGGRRPITKVDCSQQSCANLLVSVLLLNKVLNKNIKRKQGERGVSGVLTLSFTSPSAAAQRLQQRINVLAFSKTKVVLLPEPIIFQPTCLIFNCFSLSQGCPISRDSSFPR